MIKPIVSLDELTINQIAAGEVIERPASVVKELVENSIDAGATRITIEINNNKDYIKIVDNGTGIPKEDMKNAFERHATSKLRNSEDLNHINTMGFRGEALPSIASVSIVEMLSKIEDEPGNKLVIAGDKVFEFVPAGVSRGTSITVSQLFSNVPARKKFLKSDTTENRYIYEMLSKLALINNNISFTLIVNGEKKLSTRGQGILKDAVYDIFAGSADALDFKREMEDSLLDVEYATENLKITGLVGKPELSRSNRKNQIFYVNGRNIVDKNIIAAVDAAFKGRLMPGRHAFVILEIELDPSLVDVNVHPAKLEVRFKNEQEVFSGVKSALEKALSTENRVGKELEKLSFSAANNMGEEYKDKLEETRIEKSPKQLRKEALEKLANKREDLNLEINTENNESENKNNNLNMDSIETEGQTQKEFFEEILERRQKYGSGYATKEARERYKEEIRKKYERARQEIQKESKNINSKGLKLVSDVIDEHSDLKDEDKGIVKEILEIETVKDKAKNEYKSDVEEANNRLKEIQSMSDKDRQEYIKNKINKYRNKKENSLKDINLKDDKSKEKISENEFKEEIASIYDDMNSLKEVDLSKLDSNEGEIEEDIKDIEEKLNAVKKYLEKEIEDNNLNAENIDDVSEEEILNTIEKLELNEEKENYITESKSIEENIKRLDELEEKEIKEADETFEKLEGELKKDGNSNLDFSEMYKKAFGEEVFEVRQERQEEQNLLEQKIDGTDDLSSANNVSFFGNQKIQYKIVGVTFGTYILIEIGEDLYMIDQHAAHERVLYEEIKARYNSDEVVEIQMLLLPDIITLSHLEMEIVKENLDVFKKMGFILEVFGINSIKLTGVPLKFETYNTKELFLDILDEISGEENTSKKEIEDNFLATIACKAAIKANMAITNKEISTLIDKMLTLENPFSCPHGRPSAIKLNKSKIERKFNRKL